MTAAPRTPLVAAVLSAALVLPLSVMAPAVSAPGTGAPSDPENPALRSPELSTATRLDGRRSLVVGDRFYEMGAEDGSYPATGFHTRGEMGGFWTPPIKLLDGIWFRVGDTWLTASSYTSGWGYQRMDLGTHDGVRITRTDVAPDGLRAGLVGLRLTPTAGATTVDLGVDAHSELMKVYPWGETRPSQTDYNLADTGSVDGTNLVFREQGRPPVAHAETHDYAAVVGSDLTPTSSELGADHRGPQDPAVICPASGPDAPPQPDEPCDDTAYGKGTGGALSYDVDVPAAGRTVWFAVAGSDHGLAEALADQATALEDPAGLLSATVAHRRALATRTSVDLPGDRLLQQSVEWSKQNLAESVQEARDLAVRVTHAGKEYPEPTGTVAEARWIGAGWPDYPWLFATDGEYSGFAAVAAGQFGAIEDHLKALRDVSIVANGTSGKVVHEVTPDGQVYFGANGDAGNTDETAKFPSAVALVWRWTGDDGFRDSMYGFAVSNMRYIYRELDADGDGWPEGLGNVERPGMGQEKLDNTVYTIRGLRDLADLAASKGDQSTRQWADKRAHALEKRFEAAWWFGPSADQYADSLADPGNEKVFQRHWIGLTPVEAEITRPGSRTGPLATTEHGQAAVAKREESCYSGEYGLFHTGSAGCDSATSSVPAERTVFTLNTAIMAVAEGALGRTRPDQMRRYTTANARVQLDPSVWELPGAMPEISPSPDFGSNIERAFTERSMALQAWGTYGVLWPVVHFQLGVAPDLGLDRVTVVPQVPDGQGRVAGDRIRLGDGSVDVAATRSDTRLTTTVVRSDRWKLTIGAVVPSGRSVGVVTLDGRPVDAEVTRTPRGTQVRVAAGRHTGTSSLVVELSAG